MLDQVEDVGPTLYKCYTNDLCCSNIVHLFNVGSMLGQRRRFLYHLQIFLWLILRSLAGHL